MKTTTETVTHLAITIGKRYLTTNTPRGWISLLPETITAVCRPGVPRFRKLPETDVPDPKRQITVEDFYQPVWFNEYEVLKGSIW